MIFITVNSFQRHSSGKLEMGRESDVGSTGACGDQSLGSSECLATARPPGIGAHHSARQLRASRRGETPESWDSFLYRDLPVWWHVPGQPRATERGAFQQSLRYPGGAARSATKARSLPSEDLLPRQMPGRSARLRQISRLSGSRWGGHGLRDRELRESGRPNAALLFDLLLQIRVRCLAGAHRLLEPPNRRESARNRPADRERAAVLLLSQTGETAKEILTDFDGLIRILSFRNWMNKKARKLLWILL